MKKIIIVMLILGGVNSLFAQVPTQPYQKGKAFDKHPKFKTTQHSSPEKKMPLFDVSALLAEDEATRGMDLPFRFGKSFDVNLTLKDGKWQKTDSTEVWSLKITSDNAYSLNFIFSELYLPEGGELYIFNEDGSMVFGPVTEKQNNHGRKFLTDIIQGESVSIQISIPRNTKDNPKLTIQNIIHGYRDIFKSGIFPDAGYGQSENCTEDVACYSNWLNEADGVVQILLSDGSELCSGALMNNTAQDFTPYILTAFHCVDVGNLLIRNKYPYCNNDTDENNGTIEQYERDEAEEWLVRFGFKHTECDGSIIGNIYTFDDTHYRAGWDGSDFALVELADDILRDEPSVGEKVWLGWDRTSNNPSSGTCIHHPSGDIMKLSSDYGSLVTNSSQLSDGCIAWPATNFWKTEWDDGVTEGGSSGSPLFNSNKRIVGQLWGGNSSCDNQNGNSYYGRIDRSWTGGGTDETRLSNWLDPIGSGATTLNSLRQPIPEYSTGIDLLCSSTTLSVTNFAPGYYFDHWNKSSNVSLSSTTANPVQVIPGIDGPGWIEAVYHTGWGTVTMERMEFYVGGPAASEISLSLYTADGSPVTYMCPNTHYHIYVNNSGGCATSNYTWSIPSGWTQNYTYQNIISVYSGSTYGGMVEVYANTCCSDNDKIIIDYFGGGYCGTSYSLIISPNPTTYEAVVTIENTTEDGELLKSASIETTFDQDAEWILEVYDNLQSLKLKKQKLKGKSTTIQTASWKEGVYMVRVKYKDEILTGKLVVKK